MKPFQNVFFPCGGKNGENTLKHISPGAQVFISTPRCGCQHWPGILTSPLKAYSCRCVRVCSSVQSRADIHSVLELDQQFPPCLPSVWQNSFFCFFLQWTNSISIDAFDSNYTLSHSRLPDTRPRLKCDNWPLTKNHIPCSTWRQVVQHAHNYWTTYVTSVVSWINFVPIPEQQDSENYNRLD